MRLRVGGVQDLDVEDAAHVDVAGQEDDAALRCPAYSVSSPAPALRNRSVCSLQGELVAPLVARFVDVRHFERPRLIGRPSNSAWPRARCGNRQIVYVLGGLGVEQLLVRRPA